jgi:hypothetical protein
MKKPQRVCQLRHFKSAALLIAVLLLFASVPSQAQTVTGTILGTVLDTSGSAVPNAQIAITNQDTGVSRSAISTSEGIYNVPSLLPGKYSVEARAQGFSPAQVKDVEVSVGSDSRVDIKLQVGQVTQEVTITEAVPMVETTSAEVSSVMTLDVIKDLPLNARDVQQLAAIQPGVQFMNSDFGGRAMTVIGDRPSNNRFLQEGIDTTTTYRTSPVSLATGVMLGAEAVQEFKVLTTDQPAEYGEQSGGTVNVIFRSGTNALHGSAYEYYRNAVFDAKDYFDKTATAPPFHRSQFGGSLGGPIKKDNTFFFLNYEGFRAVKSLSDTANVPNALARGTGNGFGQVPNAAGTALVTVPVAPVIYNDFFAGSSPIYPACNGADLGGGLCNYSSNPLQNIDEDYGVAKIDHRFGEKNTLSSSYNLDRASALTPSNIGATMDDRVTRRQTFTLQDTHILSANIVSTARFGINRSYYNDQRDILDANGQPGTSRVDPNIIINPNNIVPCASVCTGSSTGFPSGASTPVPVISISGGMTSAFSAAPQSAFNFSPRWIGYTSGLLSDDINILHGKHAIQFGVQGKKWYDNLTQYRGNPTGTYAFQNLTQFLAGAPNTNASFTVDVIPAPANTLGVPGGRYGRNWSQWSLSVYAEDTYKLKSNLTLSYGLRWEYVPGPSEKNNLLSNLYNPTPTTASAPIFGFYFHSSKRNFAPRLGFNWDPFKQGKTSIRGGAGFFYNEIEDNSYFTYGTSQYPFVTTVSVSPGLETFPFSRTILNNFIASNGTPQNSATTTTIEANPKTPVKYEYHIAVQQQLPSHMSVMIAYVGSLTRFQGRTIPMDEYAPTGVALPGQVPTFNGQPIVINAAGTLAPINPNCTQAGQLTCLYWAGIGVQNASFLGPAGLPANMAAYAVDCTPKITKSCLNNNNFGNGISNEIFDGTGSYNGLQTSLERRMTTGLTLRLNYTFSVCKATTPDDLAGSESNGGNTTSPVLDHTAGIGPCAFSGRHAVNFNLNYMVPFGRMVTTSWVKALASDWQISSLTTVGSGIPFGTSTGLNVARAAPTGAGNDHLDWAAPSAACPNPTPDGAINKHNANNYVNVACFAPAVAGYLGDVPSYALVSPSTWTTDISLSRSVPIKWEASKLELKVDMFNAFNRANLGIPGGTTLFSNGGSNAAPTFTPSSTAGQITSVIGTSRQLQISARFSF